MGAGERGTVEANHDMCTQYTVLELLDPLKLVFHLLQIGTWK